MCHRSVLQWIPVALRRFDVAGADVLEVGSYDVNGSVRPLICAYGPALYVGVDQSTGRGVDRVCDAADLVALFGPESFDVVISTEMLEHVVDWQSSIAAMCDVLRPDGRLVLTTRSPGFPYHPFPIDTWRYPVALLAQILRRAGLVDVLAVPDPEAPGVFARARKPALWSAPWAGRSVFDVFDGCRPDQVVPA
jgi:SAM-dependent methyltransferase